MGEIQEHWLNGRDRQIKIINIIIFITNALVHFLSRFCALAHTLKIDAHNKFIEAKCRTQLLFNLAYIIMVYDVFGCTRVRLLLLTTNTNFSLSSKWLYLWYNREPNNTHHNSGRVHFFSRCFVRFSFISLLIKTHNSNQFVNQLYDFIIEELKCGRPFEKTPAKYETIVWSVNVRERARVFFNFLFWAAVSFLSVY